MGTGRLKDCFQPTRFIQTTGTTIVFWKVRMDWKNFARQFLPGAREN